MAKLVISKTPKAFPLTVKVPTPTGTDEIVFDAKHHKMSEWDKLREAHIEAVNTEVGLLFEASKKEAEAAYNKKKKAGAKEDADAVEAGIAALIKPVKDSEISVLRGKFSTALILKIANGWDLDDAFGEAALLEMCDLYRAAPEAIFKAYGEALAGERAKN